MYLPRRRNRAEKQVVAVECSRPHAANDFSLSQYGNREYSCSIPCGRRSYCRRAGGAYVGGLYELEPTWSDCAPTVHQAALAELKRTSLDRPISLRLVQTDGAPLPGEIRQDLQQILHIPVLNDYGMSETGPIATDAFFRATAFQTRRGARAGLRSLF